MVTAGAHPTNAKSEFGAILSIQDVFQLIRNG